MLATINQAGTGIQVQSRLSGCDFSIGENGGATATQLGLRTLSADTPLSDLNYGQGVSLAPATDASASYAAAGDNNGLVLTATNGGPSWNGYQVNFVNSGGAPGSESVSCNTQTKTITFSIVPGSTTANTLVSLVKNSPALSQDFNLSLDQSQGTNNGTGLVAVGSTTTEGGSNSGPDFTITRADGASLSVSLAGCQTVGDVLSAINNNPQNTPAISGGPPALVALLSPDGNGIELVDDSVGTGRLTVTADSGSSAAVDLGLIPSGDTSQNASTASTAASVSVSSPGDDNELVFSSRSDTFGNGWEVVFQNTMGSPSLDFDPTNRVMTFDINAGTTTANDIISMFDANPQATADFSLSLGADDGANDGSGLVADNTAAPAVLSGGTPQTVAGSDPNPQEVGGLFTALSRIQDGLTTNNTQEIQRGVSLLDAAVTQLNFVQADVGAREQGLQAQATNLTNQTTQLQSSLSSTQDVDMTQVITALTAAQATFQASLEAIGQIFKLTLLNYL
jgi:flagellin-like hook-associated protein FlgL